MLQQDLAAPQFYEDQAGLDPWQYVDIVRKRIFYLLIPFIVVLGLGAAAAWFWPATYMSEGKILVESQQIPTDLVKPTVTASAKERLEIIQQRVMTRSNLLGILDKYSLYPSEKDRLSRTELLDLMKKNIVITPVDVQRRGGQSDTIAMTVGFMDPNPDIATKVANDLITLFLNEDARTRTNRASETARFLGREVERLKGELTQIDKRIADANLAMARAKIEHPAASIDSTAAQLSALKAQLVEKSAIFSSAHPEIRRLKAQIKALEKAAPLAEASDKEGPGTKPVQPVAAVTIELVDALQKQRDFVQKSLDDATQKYSAAQMGQKLEQDQYSERLEVLEQAIPPQKPIKPNRTKIFGLSVIGAFMAAFAGVFTIETLDRTIRGSHDLTGIADPELLVSVPYIWTKAEQARRRRRKIILGLIALALIVVALLAVNFFVRPLDELWPILIEKIRTKLAMM